MDANAGYLKRAWNDLTSVKGWWQPIAILTLVTLIPVVGGLIVAGYLLDWAREGAWGMNRPPRRKADHIGRWLKWGFFAAVIGFVWAIVPDAVQWLLGWIPLIGWLIAIACVAAALVFDVLATVGAVNMTIYDRIKAGFQVKRIFGMAKRDVNGLVRCFGVSLLRWVPMFIAGLLVLGPLLSSMGIYGVSTSTMLDSAVNVHQDAAALLTGVGIFMSWGVFAVIVLFVAGFAYLVCDALMYRAYGYWVAQFQPAKWSGIDSPMPHEPGYVPPAPTAGAAAGSTTNAAPASEASRQETTFGDVAESAAAAAATAGAYVKEKAGHAAEAAKSAAEGFKAGPVEPDDDKPLEAQVVSVEDASAGELEGETAAVEDAAEQGAADESAVADGGVAAETPADAAPVASPEEEAPAAEPTAAAPEEPAAVETSEVEAPANAGPEAAAPVACPGCGYAVKEGQKFCVNCGAKL